MALAIIFLVLSGSGFLNSWDMSASDYYNALEGWGGSRVKRGDEEDALKTEKLLNKFVVVKERDCSTIYMTDDAPFTAIVLLKSSGRLLCMGSIVDERHILTAKKCYERAEAKDLMVLVGYYKPYWGRCSQVVRVNKIIRHEYDVALLRLTGTLTFTDYVRPAKLPPALTKKSLFTDVFPPPYQAIGFFVDRFDVPGDYIKKDKIYQIKEDGLAKFDECQTNYSRLALDKTKFFCIIGNASYCWGGWGGPVLVPVQETEWLQVGVVVLDNCTTTTTGPLLVARTDVFGDWILGNTFHGHQPS